MKILQVGFGTAHDEYVSFKINDNSLLIGDYKLGFDGILEVEFVKVCIYILISLFSIKTIPYFSAHCISDQKVRTVMVRSVQKVYFLPKILGENSLVRSVQKLRF